MTMPCLVYAGDLDEPSHSLARQAVDRMPKATFISIPGADHITAHDLALPHVRSFLARAS